MTTLTALAKPLNAAIGQQRRKKGQPARGRKREVVVKRKGPNRLEAAAWFTLAATILAFAREPADAEGGTGLPLWRRLIEDLVGVAPDSPQVQVRELAAREPGHGRDARSPREIPVAGWKDILWRTWNEFNKDRITAVAGGVTFFCLLAVFPAIAAFVALYGLFSDVNSARQQLDLLAGLLPPDALSFVGDQMIRVASQKNGGLGLAFAVSLLLSLWSANAGVKALIDGLNIAYEETERRGLVRLNLISLAFTVGGLLFLLAVLGAVVAVPVVFGLLGYSGTNLMALLRWPLLLAVVVAVLEVLYRFGPSRESPRWRWVSWGSLAAAVLWLVASMAFSFYVANFGHYDRTYGSLGAVVGFMTWLWISMIVVLLGAELNAEIEHQTAVDSTTGAPQPLGKRGAKMADTIGETAAAAKAKPQQAKMADARAERSGAARPPGSSSSKRPSA